MFTQRLQSSSFLVVTYFLLRDYNIESKKELLWSLWVDMLRALGRRASSSNLKAPRGHMMPGSWGALGMLRESFGSPC